MTIDMINNNNSNNNILRKTGKWSDF